ncbi:MAG: hypothetical protein H7Y04_08825 [Verrucomicrobia bacterium]|nr:hypothetical protein [Cytophagales bacterium]
MFEKFIIIASGRAKLTPTKLRKMLSNIDLPGCQRIDVGKYASTNNYVFKLVFANKREIQVTYSKLTFNQDLSRELAENYASQKMIKYIARCTCHISIFGDDNPAVNFSEQYDSILSIFENIEGVYVFNSLTKEFYE